LIDYFIKGLLIDDFLFIYTCEVYDYLVI